MTADLLAVLREAREALDEAIGIATDGRNYANEPEARASFGRIVQHLETVRDSALRAHEAQGWRPIDEAPKDGTEMFVVGELGWHAADAVTAYFDDRGRGCWRDRHGDRLEWEPEYFHTLNLPEPPK